VSANQALRKGMQRRSAIPVRYPPLKLCADNAAMIASAGFFRYLMGYRDDLDMDVRPMWPLVSIQDTMTRRAEPLEIDEGR
jgi:N6-L-threonylcarbamoyladenine synthase